MKVISGEMSAKGLKVGIVVSRWNELITKELLAGAEDELARHEAGEVVVVHVPGAWEIPLAARQLLKSGCNGVVALGCILQGATPHATMLATDVSSALMNLQIESAKPVSWGVLTPETQAQAFDRSGLKLGNKGREAALAVIEMLSVLGQIK